MIFKGILMQEQVESEINLLGTIGENAFIKRKRKIIKLPDFKKISMEEYAKSKLVFEDGDILSTGKRSSINISSNKKENNKDRFTQLTMLPESEAKISVEKWSKIDKINEVKLIGSVISKVEFSRGIFNVTTTEAIITPTAEIIHGQEAKPLIVEIMSNGNTVFNSQLGLVSLKCKGTGKKIEVKPAYMQEIIVTRNGIYKKGLEDIDPRFAELSSLTSFSFGPVVASISQGSEESDKRVVEQFKSFNPNDFTKNLLAFQQMDLSKVANYPGVTKEQLKQMVEGQKKMKEFYNGQGKEVFGEMQKQMSALKNDPVRMKMLEEMPQKTKLARKKMGDDTLDAFNKLEKLPVYPPLHEGFKIA